MGRPSVRLDSRPRPGAAPATEWWRSWPCDTHTNNIMLKNSSLAVCDSPLIVMESDWHFHWRLVCVSHEGWVQCCPAVLCGAERCCAGLGDADGPVKLWAKDVARRPYLLFSCVPEMKLKELCCDRGKVLCARCLCWFTSRSPGWKVFLRILEKM